MTLKIYVISNSGELKKRMARKFTCRCDDIQIVFFSLQNKKI